MLLVVQISARFHQWHSRSFQTLGRARERLTRTSTRKVPAWLPPMGFRPRQFRTSLLPWPWSSRLARNKKRPLAALQTFPCGSYSPDNWSLSLTPGRLSPAVWFRGELSPPCPTSNPASDRGSNTTKYPSHGAAALVLWLDQCVSPVGSSHLVNLRFFHGPVGATVVGCFRSVVLILPPLVVGLPNNISPVPFPGELRWTAAAHLPRASGIRERFACRRRGSDGKGSGTRNRCRGFR